MPSASQTRPPPCENAQLASARQVMPTWIEAGVSGGKLEVVGMEIRGHLIQALHWVA